MGPLFAYFNAVGSIAKFVTSFPPEMRGEFMSVIVAFNFHLNRALTMIRLFFPNLPILHGRDDMVAYFRHSAQTCHRQLEAVGLYAALEALGKHAAALYDSSRAPLPVGDLTPMTQWLIAMKSPRLLIDADLKDAFARLDRVVNHLAEADNRLLPAIVRDLQAQVSCDVDLIELYRQKVEGTLRQLDNNFGSMNLVPRMEPPSAGRLPSTPPPRANP